MRKHYGKLVAGGLCMAVLAASCLTGCSGKSETKTETAAPTTAAAAETKAPESGSEAPETEGQAQADSKYPEKEIQCIVTAAAGGGTDAMARAVCTPLEQQLGKSIVILNNGSAGGLVGMDEISKADPDGYTLGVFSNTDVANFVYGSTECTFAIDDFTYIAGLNSTGDILVLKKDSDMKTLDDFIARAGENPGQLTVALPSAIQNLSLNLLNAQLGITTTGVVYEGGNKVMADLLGGHIDAGILSAKFVSQANEQGLTVLGIMLAERLETFPDVPTFTEQGYDIENPAVRMLVGPKNLPEDVVAKLVAELETGFDGVIAESISGIDECPALLVGSELEEFLKADFAMREEMLK